MLTEEERKEILTETEIVPYPAAACLDALKIVQKHRRWVSDDAVKDIAELLGISNEEVDSVATFYSRIYRKAVGRNVILICDSMSCLIMGNESIHTYISEKLGIGFGDTTPDERFTLLPISCLGDCDHAPAMMINDDHYNNLTVEILDELLKKYS